MNRLGTIAIPVLAAALTTATPAGADDNFKMAALLPADQVYYTHPSGGELRQSNAFIRRSNHGSTDAVSMPIDTVGARLMSANINWDKLQLKLPHEISHLLQEPLGTYDIITMMQNRLVQLSRAPLVSNAPVSAGVPPRRPAALVASSKTLSSNADLPASFSQVTEVVWQPTTQAVEISERGRQALADAIGDEQEWFLRWLAKNRK